MEGGKGRGERLGLKNETESFKNVLIFLLFFLFYPDWPPGSESAYDSKPVLEVAIGKLHESRADEISSKSRRSSFQTPSSAPGSKTVESRLLWVLYTYTVQKLFLCISPRVWKSGSVHSVNHRSIRALLKGPKWERALWIILLFNGDAVS